MVNGHKGEPNQETKYYNEYPKGNRTKNKKSKTNHIENLVMVVGFEGEAALKM